MPLLPDVRKWVPHGPIQPAETALHCRRRAAAQQGGLSAWAAARARAFHCSSRPAPRRTPASHTRSRASGCSTRRVTCGPRAVLSL